MVSAAVGVAAPMPTSTSTSMPSVPVTSAVPPPVSQSTAPAPVSVPSASMPPATTTATTTSIAPPLPQSQGEQSEQDRESHLTLKRKRRLEKNRLSAQKCRKRKKEATQNLQKEILILEADNLKLKLQLKIGKEAHESTQLEQEKVMESLDTLLKSGASDSELYANIEEFKEKFADDGSHRKATVEFHLRNVARLLMPTTTTSVAIRALQGGATSSSLGSLGTTVSSTGGSMAMHTTAVPASISSVSSSSASAPQSPLPINSTEPKALFQYLVNFLQVTSAQAIALKDSRHVAKELDAALAKSLDMLSKLRSVLTQSSHDLEVEMKKIRSILSTRQAAKFLVWVANNGACMHMLNELWSRVYPEPVVSPLTAEGNFELEEIGNSDGEKKTDINTDSTCSSSSSSGDGRPKQEI